MDPQVAMALILGRDGARAALGAIPKEKDGEADPGRNQAKAGVQEVFATADRMAADLNSDVLWLNDRDPRHGGPQLCVAPLQVWGQMRDKLLADKTVVFTSATLMLGGDFNNIATSVGLKPTERVLAGGEERDRKSTRLNSSH